MKIHYLNKRENIMNVNFMKIHCFFMMNSSCTTLALSIYVIYLLMVKVKKVFTNNDPKTTYVFLSERIYK